MERSLESKRATTRVFIRALLVIVVGFGLTSGEAWPLTSFHLFSHERTRVAREYAVAAVGADGGEQRIDFTKLPPEFHGTDREIADFAGWSSARRDAACDAWVHAFNARAAFAKIYVIHRDLRFDETLDVALQYSCGHGRPR